MATIVGVIELTILLPIIIYVYLMMVLIHFHTATGTFTAIDLSLCSSDILMEIDFMLNRIYTVVIIFLLF